MEKAKKKKMGTMVVAWVIAALMFLGSVGYVGYYIYVYAQNYEAIKASQNAVRESKQKQKEAEQQTQETDETTPEQQLTETQPESNVVLNNVEETTEVEGE